MTFYETKMEIICLMENNGLLFDTSTGDLDLSDYPIDSVIFISIIVDIENRFSIVMPDEYLTIDLFKSIDGLTNLVIELSSSEECV